MKRTAIVLVSLCLVLLSACGGGKKDASALKTKNADNSASGGENAQGGSSGGSTTTTVKGSKSTGKSTSTTTKAGASSASSSTTTTKPHVPLVMKLDRQCVRRGTAGDQQGLQVHTDPGDTVAYSTEYSDHSNELSHPQWQKVGGSGYGKASSDGDYHGVWHVPDDAPTGTATLHIIAEGKIQAPITFKVVALTESC